MTDKDLNFENKVALATGATSGIGRAVAARFVARGRKVVLADRNRESGIAIKRDLNGKFKGCTLFCTTDVSDSSDVVKCVGRAHEKFGHIDYLAHCVGIQTYGSVTRATQDNWDRALATNVNSVFYLTRAVLPGMERSGSGAIVLVGSTQSLVAHRNSVAYVTAKHAIVGFMRSIVLDFVGLGIRANCVLGAQWRPR